MPHDVPSWFKPFEALVAAKPLPVGVGDEEANGPVRHDYNGRLLKNPAGTIWLVIDGVARGYTSEELFTRIHYWSITRRFGSCGDLLHSGICGTSVQSVKLINVPDLAAFIKEEAPFDASIRLIRNPDTGATYLYENNKKRHIPNMVIFDKYQFDWDDVVNYQPDIVNAIPEGDPIPDRPSD